MGTAYHRYCSMHLRGCDHMKPMHYSSRTRPISIWGISTAWHGRTPSSSRSRHTGAGTKLVRRTMQEAAADCPNTHACPVSEQGSTEGTMNVEQVGQGGANTSLAGGGMQDVESVQDADAEGVASQISVGRESSEDGKRLSSSKHDQLSASGEAVEA
eukprot:6206468-Pleurochrysis_carterae.AAC.4